MDRSHFVFVLLLFLLSGSLAATQATNRRIEPGLDRSPPGNPIGHNFPTRNEKPAWNEPFAETGYVTIPYTDTEPLYGFHDCWSPDSWELDRPYSVLANQKPEQESTADSVSDWKYRDVPWAEEELDKNLDENNDQDLSTAEEKVADHGYFEVSDKWFSVATPNESRSTVAHDFPLGYDRMLDFNDWQNQVDLDFRWRQQGNFADPEKRDWDSTGIEAQKTKKSLQACFTAISAAVSAALPDYVSDYDSCVKTLAITFSGQPGIAITQKAVIAPRVEHEAENWKWKADEYYWDREFGEFGGSHSFGPHELLDDPRWCNAVLNDDPASDGLAAVQRCLMLGVAESLNQTGEALQQAARALTVAAERIPYSNSSLQAGATRQGRQLNETTHR